MTSLERYAELEERRKALTSLTVRQKKDLIELKKKKKNKEALELEKDYENNLVELKNIMSELPFAKAAAEQEKMLSKVCTPADINTQPDNEVIYVYGEYALVLCTDGTIAYTMQPENTAQVGDLAFEADLKEFVYLPEELQAKLLTGYRNSRGKQ